MVDDRDAQCVESYQAQYRPVERVCFHHAADGDAQDSLSAATKRRRTSFGTPDTDSSHGDA